VTLGAKPLNDSLHIACVAGNEHHSGVTARVRQEKVQGEATAYLRQLQSSDGSPSAIVAKGDQSSAISTASRSVTAPGSF
jgi:hypothetical protein